MGNWNQLLPLLVFLFFVVVPGLARVYQALKEQAAVRERELARRQQAQDAIRTGRAPNPPTAPVPPRPAASRLEEVMARRRAQLEDMRRRAQTGASPTGRTPTSVRQVPPTARTPQPPAASTVRTIPPQRLPAPQRKRPPKPRPEVAARPVRRQSVLQPELPQAGIAAPLSEVTIEAADRPSPREELRNLSRAELRRAVILKELLSPPLALRSNLGLDD